jgi:hypothetical protein
MLRQQQSRIDTLRGAVNALPEAERLPVHQAFSEDQFRRRDVLALPVGDDQVLLVGDPARHELVSRADFALLHSCTRFATLEAHAEALARRPGVSPGSRALFRRQLEEFAARGLLDRASLVGRGGYACTETPVSLHTVTIPTRNRPEAIVRAVASVAQAARCSDRTIDCVVIDDSEDGLLPLECQGIRALVVSRPERERLAAVLAAESGVPIEVVRRAVLGDPVHGWRPGAAYNVALLLTAGQAFLSIDDDAVLRLAASPAYEPGARATSTSDPTEFWFFRDRATALATPLVDLDPFEAVERVLGRPAAAVLADGTDAPWVDDVAPPLAHVLGSGSAQVAATSFGVLGDSGMGSVRYYLHLRGDSLRRAVPDDLTWAWVRTTRAVLRATNQVVLSGGMHFMAGAVGLDHRGFLPPFPPSGRGADGRFAQLLRLCRDEALIAHLPWAVFHDPLEQRIASMPLLRQLHLLEPLAWVTALCHFGPTVTAEDRLRAIGATLEEYGRLPLSAFEEFVRMWCWKRYSDEIMHLEAQLASPPSLAFAADLRRNITALRAQLLDNTAPRLAEFAERPVLEALAATQGYLGRFGELLGAWPSLVTTARRLPMLAMIAAT